MSKLGTRANKSSNYYFFLDCQRPMTDIYNVTKNLETEIICKKFN